MAGKEKVSHKVQHVVSDLNMSGDRLFRARSAVEECVHPAVAQEVAKLMDEAAAKMTEARHALEAYRDRLVIHGN